MADNLSYYVLLGIFGIGLHLIALYAMRNRLKHNNYFVIILFSMMLSWVILVFAPYYKVTDQVEIVENLVNFALITVLIIFLNAYLYYESLLNLKPPVWRLTVFIFIFLLNTGLIILDMTRIYRTEWLFFITYTSALIVCIFVLSVLIETHKLKNHNAVKIDIIAVLFMLIGSLIYQYHALLVQNGVVVRFTPESSSVYTFGAIFFLGSVFILAYNSHKNGDYIHYLPIQIYSILLYNGAGLLAYKREIQYENIEGLQEPADLISGALMAFDGFFKGILGTKAKLTHINASAYEFAFSELPNKGGTVVVISSKVNYFVNKSLKKLGSAMSPELLSVINKPGIGQGSNEKIDALIKEHFPYINF